MSTVTVADRMRGWKTLAELRKAGAWFEAGVIRDCQYWESFPTSYAPEFVQAAIAVLTAEPGTEAYHVAMWRAAILGGRA